MELSVSITGKSVLKGLGGRYEPIPAHLSASSWVKASVFNALTLNEKDIQQVKQITPNWI